MQDKKLPGRIFTSSKRFGPISTGHRQWRHEGHCAFVHGYGRIVEITFGSKSLDNRGWVVDFGSLKWVKSFLESEWDHRLLLAHDDPELEIFKELDDLGIVDINILPEEYGPGIEHSAKYVFDYVDKELKKITLDRCFVESVKVYEHEKKWAEVKRGDYA